MASHHRRDVIGIDLSIDQGIVLRNYHQCMTSATLSPKFQIVIPKAVREALKLVPGRKFHVLHHNGRIELIPVRDAKTMRGFLRGINTRVRRDADRK
jgi:AbrB family looped-hinge helix DNA binding protein